MSGLSISSVAKAATSAPSKMDELKTAAKQFEAIFARQVIGAMRSAKLGDDILSSEAGNQFRDMADARIADDMAQKGALGIADMLVKQFGARMKAAEATAQATEANKS